MDVNQTIKDAEDALTVRRVFGEPYQHDDITIIPVARVAGAAGGGEGADGRGEGGGSASASRRRRWGCTSFAAIRWNGDRRWM